MARTDATYDRTKRLTWEPSYVAREELFPSAASEGIYFGDWNEWDDPFHMHYRQYIEVQAKKEIDFHPTREAFGRYQGPGKIDERWMEGIKIVYPYLMIGEYAANRSHNRVARYAPAPALREASFYQAIDELRHSQNHLYQIRLLNQSGDGFDNWAHWQRHHFLLRPSRAAFEDILACQNIFEAIVGLNLVAEVGMTNLIFIAIPAVAALNGDPNLAQEFLTTQSDETRHMAIGQSSVRMVLEGDSRNLKPMQYWLDKHFWLQHRAIGAPVSLVIDYFARNKAMSFKEAYQRYVVENFVGGLVTDLGKFGLKPPRFLDIAVRELDDLSHSLFRALYQYKHVLFSKVFKPTNQDFDFFSAKYPGFEKRHGPFWEEVRAGDPKDLATLPMLCQVCQLPCVWPTPEDPSIEVRELNERVYTFCSMPCAWIFDNEPHRYSHAVTLDRVLNGKDVQQIRAYMGLHGKLGGELADELV